MASSENESYVSKEVQTRSTLREACSLSTVLTVKISVTSIIEVINIVSRNTSRRDFGRSSRTTSMRVLDGLASRHAHHPDLNACSRVARLQPSTSGRMHGVAKVCHQLKSIANPLKRRWSSWIISDPFNRPWIFKRVEYPPYEWRCFSILVACTCLRRVITMKRSVPAKRPLYLVGTVASDSQRLSCYHVAVVNALTEW